MPNQRAEIRPESSIRYKGRVYKRGEEDALIEAGFGSDEAKPAARSVGANKRKPESGAEMVQRLTDSGDIVGFGATPSDGSLGKSGAGVLGVRPGERVPLGAGARRDNSLAGQDTQRIENGGDGEPAGHTGATRDLANRTSSDTPADTSGADESSGVSKSSSGASKRSSSGTGGRSRK